MYKLNATNRLNIIKMMRGLPTDLPNRMPMDLKTARDAVRYLESVGMNSDWWQELFEGLKHYHRELDTQWVTPIGSWTKDFDHYDDQANMYYGLDDCDSKIDWDSLVY